MRGPFSAAADAETDVSCACRFDSFADASYFDSPFLHFFVKLLTLFSMSEEKGSDLIVFLKQSRAGHLSDVTKKKMLCDEAFASDDPLSELKSKVGAYELAFTKFVVAHEHYMSAEKEQSKIDNATQVYEQHRDALLRFQTAISTHKGSVKGSELKVAPSMRSFRSDDGSRVSKAELSLRKADIKLQMLHRRHELEKEAAEIQRQREILEAETLRCLAEEALKIEADDHAASCVKPQKDKPLEHAEGRVEGFDSIQSLKMIAETVSRTFSLPPIELIKFDGDPLVYSEFIKNFVDHIEKNVSDPSLRLTRLIAQCQGKAKEAIVSCVTLPSREGYDTAKKVLFTNFGQPYMVANAHIKKLKSVKLRGSDAASLLEFSRTLECAQRALTGIGVEHSSRLDNDDLIVAMMRKFTSEDLKRRWCKRAGALMSLQGVVRFRNFVEFVSEEGSLLNNAYAEELDFKRKGVTAATSCSHKTERPNSLSGCVLLCQGSHPIWKCPKFLDLTVQDRWNFVKKHKLCISCLAKGHLAAKCKRNFSCKVTNCGRSHHNLLHNSSAMRDSFRADDRRSLTQGSDDPSTDCVQKDNSPHLVGCCSSTEAGKARNKICFKIVPVRVKGVVRDVDTYAFLDSGSNTTMCLESLVEDLGIPSDSGQVDFRLHTITGENDVTGKEVTLNIGSIDGRTQFRLKNVLTTETIPVDDDNLAHSSELKLWPHLSDLKLHSVPHGKVTMLIGLDHPEIVERQLAVRRGKTGGPLGIKTPLGWTVCGRVGTTSSPKTRVNFLAMDQSINERLDKLFNTEFRDGLLDSADMSVEDAKAKMIMDNSSKRVDGHYEIGLPFKTNPPVLPNNMEMAQKRLDRLRAKLERNPGMKESYHSVLKQYEEEGAASLVGSLEDCIQGESSWFLPHHGVYSAKKPNVPRVVFDCAAVWQGTSLNEQLLKGPDNTNSLLGVIFRFRVGRVAVISDVKRMFHQVFVPLEERRFLRYLWWPDLDFTKGAKVFEMKVHLFGATSSPSVCSYALRKTADDCRNKFSEAAVNAVWKNFYIDDFAKAFSDERQAIETSKEVCSLLSFGGFKLTKWMSNSKTVVESFPEEDRAAPVKNLNIDFSDSTSEKILGVQWNLEDDVLSTLSKDLKFPRTRRGVLSSIAVIYDPLGMASPLLLPGREIHQELCRRGASWDEEMPDDLGERWDEWVQEIQTIDCRIPRSLLPNDDIKIVRCELHNFSDASEAHGYGTVSYLRFIGENGEVHCAFAFAKSRVRPLRKGVTVPRLELTAATVLVSISAMIVLELTSCLKIDSVTFWTDSMIVLYYLRATDKRQDRFVANRVAKILDGSSQEQWRFVQSKDNPADIASRGLRVYQHQKLETWLRGPEFLWRSDCEWNFEPNVVSSHDDKVVSASRVDEMDFWECLCRRYSSWTKLLQIVARLLDAVNRWKAFRRDQADNSKKPVVEPLKVADLQSAEEKLVSVAQKDLRDRIKDLSRLNVENRDNFLCVGGRLTNASISDEKKHPKILPSNHKVTELMIADCHRKCGHQGINYTLSKLREKYWILHGYSTVKRVLHGCHACRRMHGRAQTQITASLPKARVDISNEDSKYPFSSVGVDFFGPFYVTLGPNTRSRTTVWHKRYGCIFTCLRMRAVHIEMVRDLSSDGFIMAVLRFVARRGPPMEIFSDNGTNFRGSSSEIVDALKLWNHENVQRRLAEHRIVWHFNPPAASHQGGVWERIIRSIRRIFESLVGKNKLNDETLCTVFCEVEKILNDRPITRVSTDPDDLESLTPNHLLLLRRNSSASLNELNERNPMRGRWKYAQALSDQFWSRWQKEYLSALQSRQKWLIKTRNLRKGDLVLIMDENLPRGHWRKGLVVDSYEDKEGCVRRVALRTENGVLLRDIRKVCLLEESVEL